MRYIETFREGLHISDVYLCKNKQIALTKAGKEYGNLILQDKTGTIDAKIWDLNSPGVGNFETMEEDVQKLTDKYVKNIDAAVEEKQKEIMSV